MIQRNGIEFANVEWSRKNRKAGRPFIEHQLDIVDFSVALQVATGARRDVQFIRPNDIIAAFPERAARNPLSLRVPEHRNLALDPALLEAPPTTRIVSVVPPFPEPRSSLAGTRPCVPGACSRRTPHRSKGVFP